MALPTLGIPDLADVRPKPVAALLDDLRPRGVVPLHDRRIPGSQTGIDHVVIAPSGVWIVDSRLSRGRIERRGRRANARLFVDRRDRTNLVAETVTLGDAVRAAIAVREVPIHRVLCFRGAEWPFFAKSFELDGVWVMWPKALIDAIVDAGGRGLAVPDISRAIATRLPAAS
ncbi:MAG TPA: nuclease-related domain-containing protein [Candidatus Elarobacter sp.]|nr:nuclease-related domain-containing protein [Candidatus Elarobacter sp.]